MELTLYTADCTGNAANCLYQHKKKITDQKELVEAIAQDQVFAKYKDSYRSIENFISASVIPLDCDNDHTEKPEEWLTADKLTEIFEDMQFVLIPSRNHMKQKNGKAARPKYHVLFPVAEYTDPTLYAAVKSAIQKKYPFFDDNAVDAARFFFGSKCTEDDVVWHDGFLQIDEDLDETDMLEQEEAAMPIYMGGSITEGSRNNTMSHYAGRVLKKFGITDKAYQLYMERAEKCEPPLSKAELDTIWKSAVKFANKVQAQDGYIPPDKFNDEFCAGSLKPEDYSDIGEAKVLSRENIDCLRFTNATGFLTYCGDRWHEDTQKALGITENFLDIQLADANEAIKCAEDALIAAGVPEESVRACGKTLDKAVPAAKMGLLYALIAAQAYHKFVMKYRNYKNIVNTQNAAKPMLAIDVSELDYARQVYPYGYSWSGFQKINGGYLVSGAGTGLLFYDENAKTAVQIYSKGTYWSRFIEVTGGYLVSSSNSSSYGILFVDTQKHTAVQIYTLGYNWSYGIKADGGLLLSSNSSSYGIVLYDEKTHTAEQKYTAGYQWQYSCDVEGGTLISSYRSGTGLLFFDNTTKAITQVSNLSYRWQYFCKTDGGAVCSSSVSGTGILYFDSESKTAQRVYTTGYGYSYLTAVKGGCLCSSSQSSYGLIFVDNSGTAKALVSTGYWSMMKRVGDDCLVSGTSSDCGLRLFDSESKTLTSLYGSYYWNCFQEVESGCLVGSSNSSTQGLLFYDGTSKSLSLLLSGTYWQHFKLTAKGCLVSADSSTNLGIYYFKNSSKELVKLTDTGYCWYCWVDTDGGVLISSASSYYGIYQFDEAAETVTQKYTAGYNWRNVHEVDGGLLIYSNSTSTGIVYWNEGAKTISCLYNSGCSYSIIHKVRDGYLLAANSSNYPGIVYVEPSTESGKKVWTTSYNWSDFEDTDGGCRIYQKYTHFVKSLFWSDEDKAITET